MMIGASLHRLQLAAHLDALHVRQHSRLSPRGAPPRSARVERLLAGLECQDHHNPPPVSTSRILPADLSVRLRRREIRLVRYQRPPRFRLD